MEQRAHNFNPGPGVLPLEVLQEVQENLFSYKKSGIGLMEMSHRGSDFQEIIDQAQSDLRDLLKLPESYDILFTTGGATTQFSMIPLNLLQAGQQANYLLSGVWAEAAAEEAKKFGEVYISGSTKEESYTAVPALLNLSSNPAYLHFTSNNTVIGSQFPSTPEVPDSVPLICDASSDLLSREVDIERYSLLYAGAQKNLGAAGVTIVILKKKLLDNIPAGLPLMLDYRTYAKHQSLYNTPPTFNIYVVGRVLAWIKRLGGVSAIEKINREKAELLYQVIDNNPVYEGVVTKSSRSNMNVTFRLRNLELEKKFLKEAEGASLVGLKGHRLVGGCRASIYNACPIESVRALASFMTAFAADQ